MKRRLTPRQRQILAYVLLGYPDAQIAALTGLTLSGARTWRARVTGIVGKSKCGLVRHAVAKGWLKSNGVGGLEVTFSFPAITAPLNPGRPRKVQAAA